MENIKNKQEKKPIKKHSKKNIIPPVKVVWIYYPVYIPYIPVYPQYYPCYPYTTIITTTTGTPNFYQTTTSTSDDPNFYQNTTTQTE